MSNLIALKDYIIQGIGNVAVKIRLTDNLDGTYSEGVGGSGGGGGGAVTQAAGSVAAGAYVAGAMVDGAIVTLGSEADATATSDSGTFSLIALFKRSLASLTSLIGVFSAGTQVTSTAAESSHVLKSSAGTLFMAVVYNNGTVAQWYQIHDAATAPSVGAVPKMTLKVSPSGSGNFDYGLRGRAFATGIFITNSTTALTYTAGAADSFYDASIK